MPEKHSRDPAGAGIRPTAVAAAGHAEAAGTWPGKIQQMDFDQSRC